LDSLVIGVASLPGDKTCTERKSLILFMVFYDRESILLLLAVPSFYIRC
jgi:hypothetical protein